MLYIYLFLMKLLFLESKDGLDQKCLRFSLDQQYNITDYGVQSVASCTTIQSLVTIAYIPYSPSFPPSPVVMHTYVTNPYKPQSCQAAPSSFWHLNTANVQVNRHIRV